jgi:hypothetical protein
LYSYLCDLCDLCERSSEFEADATILARRLANVVATKGRGNASG